MKMKLKNKYFLLRHGQTIYQTKKKNLVYPRSNKSKVNLTKRGENQVKKAAQELKKQKIDLIFTSDFFRTRQTAKITAKELKLEVNFDKRLRDLDWGVYRGVPKKEVYCYFSRHPGHRFYQRPPQGESWSDCKKRMINFIKEIDKKYKNKNILIISHGDPLWLLEGAVKELTNKELLENKYKNLFLDVGEFKKL